MFKKSIILYNICQVFFQKNSRSTDEISQHPHIFCINMQMKPIFFIIHIPCTIKKVSATQKHHNPKYKN